MTKAKLDALRSEEGLELIPGVRIRLRQIKDYQQKPNNPVAHSEHNYNVVLESIQRLKACRSGFAADNEILGGNLTQQAMSAAGIDEVIEITTEGTQWVMVNRPDLTPEQRKQASYADQQGAFLAGWQIQQVMADIEAGLDLVGLMTDEEIAAILESGADQSRPGRQSQQDEGFEIVEEILPIICPECGHEFALE